MNKLKLGLTAVIICAFAAVIFIFAGMTRNLEKEYTSAYNEASESSRTEVVIIEKAENSADYVAERVVSIIDEKAANIERSAGEAASYAAIKKAPAIFKYFAIKDKNRYYSDYGIVFDCVIIGSEKSVYENRNYSDVEAFNKVQNGGTAYSYDADARMVYYACKEDASDPTIICSIDAGYFAEAVSGIGGGYSGVIKNGKDLISADADKLSGESVTARSQKTGFSVTIYGGEGAKEERTETAVPASSNKKPADTSSYGKTVKNASLCAAGIALAAVVIMWIMVSLTKRPEKEAVSGSVYSLPGSADNASSASASYNDTKYSRPAAETRAVLSASDKALIEEAKKEKAAAEKLAAEAKREKADAEKLMAEARGEARTLAMEEYSARTASVSDKLEVIARSSEEISDSVRDAADKLGESGRILDEERKCNEEFAAVVAEISEQSVQIKKIIADMEDIAFNTNMLALNAAIEAARAGENGKSFAVVADEVRNLALKSSESVKFSETIINNTMLSVKKSNDISERTAKLLGEALEASSSAEQAVRALEESVSARSRDIRAAGDELKG